MTIEYIITVIKQPKRIVNFIKRKILYVLTFDIIEFFLSINTIYRLSKIKYQPKSVLMIEPNEFHGEILPGFCYYFNELGFQVTLLVKRENYTNGLFTLFNDDELPEILCTGNIFLKKCIKYRHKFDLIMLTSSTIGQKYNYYGFLFDYIGFIPNGKQGHLIIEHNICQLIPSIENNKINCQNVFSLIQHDEFKIKMLNPNYFGSKINKIKNEIITFITIGSLNTNSRNFDVLIDTVNELRYKNVNFQVFVIGRDIRKSFNNNFPEQIKILGELNFNKMYQYLLQSDFFLPLLDPECNGHKKYLKEQVTGSIQLILGFNIIPLIQTQFAESYNFDQTNAIVYEKSLFEAMLNAMNLSEEERYTKEKMLDKLTAKIRKESLQNLKNRLKQIKNEEVRLY